MKMKINGTVITFHEKTQTDSTGVTRHYLRACIPIGYNPTTQTLIRKEVTAPDEETLKAKIAKLMFATQLQPDAELTFADYYSHWLERNSPFFSACSRKSRDYWKTYIIQHIGNYQMKDLDEEILSEFYQTAREERGDHNTFTMNRMLGRPLREAWENHLMYNNPQAHIHIPKPQRKDIVPLTENEAKQLLSLCQKDLIYGRLIAFDLLTGLRISECIGLPLDSYDPAKHTITVYRQLNEISKECPVQNYTKNHEERCLRLGDQASAILEAQIAQQNKLRAAAGDKWDNPYNCIFTDQNGSYLHHNAVRKRLHFMCKEIGIPDFKFHHLRHSFASIIVDRTGNISLAKDLLGHARYDTTGHYVHSSPDAQAAAFNAVADYCTE